MKKMIKSILTIMVILFASISLFNCAYAQNDVTATGNTPSLISTQNTAANQVTQNNQTNTQITTTVSSTSSADDGFLSPTNIINILLIAVGVVLILLAIAILTKIGKSK